jgi:hypothetical protein
VGQENAFPIAYLPIIARQGRSVSKIALWPKETVRGRRNFAMFEKYRNELRALFTFSIAVAGIATFAGGRAAFAMPIFARRLGVSCSTCHTSPPRLNETGYQFRAAGYRMPAEIGKGGENKPFKFFDYNGVRLQARYDATRARTGPDAPHSNNFNLFAAELYAFTGAWGKNLSSNIKATVYPEKSYDTEDHVRVEGNIKATFGGEKRFFEIRAGVPHPMEGFGRHDHRHAPLLAGKCGELQPDDVLHAVEFPPGRSDIRLLSRADCDPSPSACRRKVTRQRSRT